MQRFADDLREAAAARRAGDDWRAQHFEQCAAQARHEATEDAKRIAGDKPKRARALLLSVGYGEAEACDMVDTWNGHEHKVDARRAIAGKSPRRRDTSTRDATVTSRPRAAAKPVKIVSRAEWNRLIKALDPVLKGIVARLDALEAGKGARSADEHVELGARSADETTPAPTARAGKTLKLSLLGKITAAKVKSLVQDIRRDPQRPIKLTISSPGGSLIAAHDLADALLQHRGEVHCHGVAEVASAAVLPYVAAAKRTAVVGCAFTLHRPRMAYDARIWGSVDRFEGAIDGAVHGFARVLASRCDRPATDFAALLSSRKGQKLRASEAAALGIVNGAILRARKAA